MSDATDTTLWMHEVELVAAAMRWFDLMWPFDPDYADDCESRPFWPELSGEVACPVRLEVRHHDGYRIGWVENRDEQTVFVRDYADDRDAALATDED